MSNKTMSSFMWKFFESCGQQTISFALSIILARLIVPDDFGSLALIGGLMGFAHIFAQSGLISALIQKKEASAIDFSSAFWLSLTFSAVLYVILFFTAPIFARIYENENYTLVVRVLGINLFLATFNSIQEAYVIKHFLFKEMFLRSIVVIVPSAMLSIALAYYGFGIWALVWQTLASSFLMSVFMYFVIPWKPTFEFSIVNAKKLFNFGYKLLLSSLLDAGRGNLTSLFVGKIFPVATLAFYARGEYLPAAIVGNINGSINTVLYPALVNVQDDIVQFKQRTKKSLKCSCFVIFPLMAILACSSAPLVRILFGEIWLPCVMFMQLGCFVYALWPLHTTNSTAINSLGRSDIYLKLEIIKTIVSIFAVGIALYFFRTPFALALTLAIAAPIFAFINSFPNKKLMNYGFAEQVKDILPIFIFSLIAGITIFPISRLAIPDFVIITSQGLIGMAVYLLLARIFKMEGLSYLLELINKIKKGRKKERA